MEMWNWRFYKAKNEFGILNREYRIFKNTIVEIWLKRNMI